MPEIVWVDKSPLSDKSPLVDLGDPMDFSMHVDRLDLGDPLDLGNLAVDAAGDSLFMDGVDHGDSLNIVAPGRPSPSETAPAKRRLLKHWWDIEPGEDEYTDESDLASDIVPARGDAIVFRRPDVTRFTVLSAHLGGLGMMDITSYEERFGELSDAHPFGNRVWHGLEQALIEYPFMSKISGVVPWLGYFISPVLFSKATSAAPVSADCPSLPWVLGNSYPAIFMMTMTQHIELSRVIANAGCGGTPDDMDFYDDVELSGRSRLSESQKVSDAWKIVGGMRIEFDASEFGWVDMLCLKILIAKCRPWNYVHASRMRLHKPLSRL